MSSHSIRTIEATAAAPRSVEHHQQRKTHRVGQECLLLGVDGVRVAHDASLMEPSIQ